MKALSVIAGLATLFVTLPIWYYLLYQVLSKVQATELMWFLFWVYVPVNLFVMAAMKVAQSEK